jgi:lipid-binding SYLF domain-containing protein
VREAANQAYYGRPVTTADILRGGVSNPAADPLRRALPPAR